MHWLLSREAFFILGAALFSVAVVYSLRRFRRYPEPQTPTDATPEIQVESLTRPDIAGAACQLELYHLPVQLIGVVIAPMGRDRELPEDLKLTELIDHIVPGLGDIYDSHQPHLWKWPSQLSSQGFVRTFFARTVLPGDAGKGTPWAAAAGRFGAGEQKYMIGLIFWAQKPNSLGQIAVERDTQWLDILRVRGS